MKLFRTVRVADHQRAVVFRDGNLLSLLMPGTYRFVRRARHISVFMANGRSVEFVHDNLRYLVQAHRELLEPNMHIAEVAERQVGLLRVNGVATRLLVPGSVHAFWVHANDVAVEYADHDGDLEFPLAWQKAIELAGDRFEVASLGAVALMVSVEQGREALLLQDEKLVRVLKPGRHAFWRVAANLQVVTADLRVQELELAGQEILTKDRVSLRLNAATQYRVHNAERALVDVPNVRELAYRATQFALREAVGGVTLDELLADKSTLATALLADVSEQFAALGLTVERVGIKDVILPGEMKAILNQVVEAEKRSEANAVRRRDEAANVRALANAAKVLEGNPMMARLKELEVLESITKGVDSLHVMNGLDGVLNRLLPTEK